MTLSAVASMRPTEALASVKFWRISPIIFILHKRSSDIFNASWYYKEFSNSVNMLWLHVSFLTHLNQPLPINNTTALTSA